jgi:hypothetical protein
LLVIRNSTMRHRFISAVLGGCSLYKSASCCFFSLRSSLYAKKAQLASFLLLISGHILSLNPSENNPSS